MSEPVVAVVGGGQLARMMQEAAVAIGVRLQALVEAPDGSTARAVPSSSVGAASDLDAVRRICRGADVLTFEHEHVPQTLLARLRGEIPIRPAPEALLYAQDKLAMRERIHALGVPGPRWARVESPAGLRRFGDAVGWPVIVKEPVGGYDGHGVRVAHAAGEASDWLQEGHPLLAEERVPFAREIAVLLARRPSGEVRTWPVMETIQRHGVCSEVIAPAPRLDPAVAREANAIGERIATALGVTGILAVEMFLVEDEAGQRVYVNELAMRPHNSGHWTIDGSVTSQFEQHLRAVLDLPLGETAARAPWTCMVNLLGSNRAEPSDGLAAAFAVSPRAHVHLYGKSVRPGRKLGHVTVCGEDLEQTRAEAERALRALRGDAAGEPEPAGAASRSRAE